MHGTATHDGAGAHRTSTTGADILRHTMREHRVRLLGATGLFVCHQLGEVLVPVVAGLAIDRAIVDPDASTLLRWLVVLAAVFAVLSTSWRVADRLLTACVEDAAHALRLRVTDRLLAPAGAAGLPSSGEVVSVATTDVGATVQVLVAVAAGAAGAAALIASAVVVLSISVALGLVVLIGLPVVVGILHLLVRPLEQRMGARRADAARAAALATDLLAGVRVLAGLRTGAAAAARYRAASQRSLGASLSAARLAAVHEGLTVAATGGFIAVVALVSGRLAATGDITIGSLVAAVGVTQFLVGPLWRIGFATSTLARARASADRVAAVLAAGDAVAEGDQDVPAGPGTVVLHGVRHRGLHDLDLTIPGGRFVGVAALDAGDALALVELLERGTDPAVGRVELDGVPLHALRTEQLRRSLLVARHDAVLFSGSVADIVGSAAGATLDPGEALAAAGADDLHETLPDGLATTVAARGSTLSGGQRQRVALARALAPTSRVLVLHDPTTAIDPATEARVAHGLRALRRGATTIAITTSPALLAVADEVVVLDGGAVSGTGTHEELLTTHPRYAAVVLS